MATLVLSTAGMLLGGPVGSAIGGLLGQSIDQQLFGPGPREGPRLGDLAVQTSNYGTSIPRIYGTMRVAGCIIWSTDLQEDSQTEGAKGQPETVTYSYSVSFAVALSSRRINNVRRIWADGKLIRDAEGEFTVSTVFRFFGGTDDQAVDPLIASIEGVDSTPAYRGIALAVFEHLQLAAFGNRIPFLTFEVEADAGAVPLDTILGDISNGAIASGSNWAVTGYAAYGTTIVSAVEPLVEIFGVSLFDDGNCLVSPAPAIETVADDELGCAAGPDSFARLDRSQVAMRHLPSALSLNYYEPEREYQAGLARAAVDAVDSGAAAEEKLELPASLGATTAKALAETSLARRWAERDKLLIRLPPAHVTVRPGMLLQVGEGGETWKAERITLDSMTVVAELRAIYSSVVSLPADPGRVLPSLGVEPAPTTVSAMELPDDESGSAEAPVVAVAASTSSGSARAVPLEIEIGGRGLGTFVAAPTAVIGTAATVLAPGQASVFDCLNSVDVELPNPDQWLESRDDVVTAHMQNLALIGSELVQFEEVIPIEPGRFRLRRLLRGRRGTEWAMGLHSIGEQFVLVEPARLLQLPLRSVDIGAVIKVEPRGLADSPAGAAEIVVSGEAMRPPSPAHLRASLDDDGNLCCSWVRRSRRGWAWLDWVDAPLDSSHERYCVSLRSSSARLDVETTTSQAEFSAGDLASLEGNLELSVVQVGDLAISHPASITIHLT